MSHSEECYRAIKEFVEKVVAADPVRCRIAVNEEDDSTGHQPEAHEFLKVDGQRWGRDFKVYGMIAEMSGSTGGGLADFADLILMIRDKLPSVYKSVKWIVLSWDRFFSGPWKRDWLSIWDDGVETGEYELVLPFYIDTDGYTDRDREMFVCGFEFNSIYQAVQAKNDWNQPIHAENASRVRMMCGKLGVPVKLTPICDTWTDCEIPASTTL